MGRFFARSAAPGYGDSERFGLLYEATKADLLAFLLRRCAPEVAADCLSETYRIAWEKRTRIPAGEQARPWLFGVARNVIRREVAHDEQRAAVVRELAMSVERAGAVKPEERGAVQNALSSLSPVDQEIITMLSWDGLTPRDVALILGLSPNVVRVRAHRARERLRALLARRDEPERADALGEARPLRYQSVEAGCDARPE